MPSILTKPVGPVGYGLMGLTWRPTVTPDPQAFAAMSAALSAGCNFWNAGEFYGKPPDITGNLSLLARYFAARPENAEKVVLSVKGSVDLVRLVPKGDRASIHASIENVLRLLDGKKFLDIFECPRVDKTVDIEETVSAIAEYVKAGKVGGIGLSETGPATIRRAHKVHPIACVEVEASLWSTEIFAPGGVAETCAELGIPIAAYSPLGRGFLTGQIRSPDDIPEGDFRRHLDRFQPENFGKNLKLLEAVEEEAREKGVTPAQLALAWVFKKGNSEGKATIIPIPGATKEERVLENAGAVNVKLSEEDEKKLDDIIASIEIVGARYNAAAEDTLLV